AFEFLPGGDKLKRPAKFFRGISVLEDPVYSPDPGGPIVTLKVRYGERTDKEDKKSPILAKTTDLEVLPDKQLGFGGYVSRESLKGMLKDPKFKHLSPISFPDPAISPEGDLVASGEILSSNKLLPELPIPIVLRGSDVFLNFPIPTESLKFGPVTVTEAALMIGVGDKGFFMEGAATILIKDIGTGTISARGEGDGVTLYGKLALDLDFLEQAELDVTYILAKDDFKATGKFKVGKDKLPGVDSGQIDVSLTRQSFGLVGTLQLGGLFKGSTITAGYTSETGLLIEGKDLPLPVSKVPGVSDAKATVRARRNPDTGDWAVSGGGKATLSGGGASGTLDVLVDGLAVDFSGRVDVAKGPASGWLQISASNRAVDDEGKPVEGGKLGELAIWGKGEAKVAFGKVLTGTAGIEYTREGHVIVVGEIAMPPTYDLFPKKDLSPDKPLFKFKTPDFPIWGVKVGPVGVGVFAFADASLVATAWVGPGQLRNALVAGTMDLDKPEEAKVEGKAQFYVPAYAGLTLDIGGGLKAQAAVAYVKGRVGIYASLGLLIEGMFDIGVTWSQAQGLAIEATPAILASPKFEVGVTASVAVGVDLGLFDIEKEWGPWKEKLGEFGPDMQFGAKFPMAWSEVEGLDIDPGKIEIQQPNIDAPALMKDTFLALV
ncbi:hypothetical protein, partial [Sphingomonas sp.]|uniref:hypothetical protein n=1 Tax=Sphingomonas sp. TaxID=28214 RepID=UPI00286E527F